jgi:TRAP-type C4-dicarboxylate transport system permease small subunit
MTLARFRSSVDKVVEWMLIIVFMTMTVNVLWQVFTRFVLHNPSSYTEELSRYLLVWLGMLGGAYAVGKRLHLAIDLVPRMVTGRRRELLEILIQSCVFLFALFVVLIGGANLVNLTLTLRQVSAALQIQLGYVYSVLPLSGALMMFYSGTFIYDGLQQLKKKSYGMA